MVDFDRAEESAEESRSGIGGVAIESLIALSCVVVVSYLGIGAFGAPQAGFFNPLGPLAGVIAALACHRWWLAGPAAGIGVVAGTAFGEAYSPVATGALRVPTSYWVVAAVALLVGAGLAALLERHDELTRWVARVGLGLVLLAACLAGWTYGTTAVDLPYTPIAFFSATPTISAGMADEQVYILTMRRMEAGQNYYAALGRTLAELNAVRPQGPVDLSKPIAFRLPTLYWFLAALPAGGFSWVIAMLVVVAAGIVAAWTIASRYVQPAVALVGATLTAIYLAHFTGLNLPDAELWAGALGLVAVALALKALSVRRRPWAWATVAAAVALVATLTRELAVAFLLVGLASSLVAARTRAFRLWVPWVAALGLAVVAYLAHIRAVVATERLLPHAAVASVRYFDPTGRGLAASIVMLALYSWWTTPAAWSVWALGTVGGVVAPRDWPRRALLGGVTAGGAVVLFFLHPSAAPNWPIPGIWGQIVLPTVIACVPLALARVPRLGRLPRS